MLFAAACVVLTATPGPDMLLIASRTISQGRAAGFLTYAGIAFGTYCHALAAALGLSQLFVAVPIAYEIGPLHDRAFSAVKLMPLDPTVCLRNGASAIMRSF